MIKCKEDLINTYVKNTPELRREFLSLAVKFGLIDSKSDIGQSSEESVVAYWHNVTGDNPMVGCWFVYADQIKEECRELTLSDLKPRTRTEYEKVTESIFDLRDEFERGELYFQQGGEYLPYKLEAEFAHGFMHDRIYRKVEKEIDERQEFVERASGLVSKSHAVDYSLGKMYDAGCRFVGANGEIE